MIVVWRSLSALDIRWEVAVSEIVADYAGRGVNITFQNIGDDHDDQLVIYAYHASLHARISADEDVIKLLATQPARSRVCLVACDLTDPPLKHMTVESFLNSCTTGIGPRHVLRAEGIQQLSTGVSSMIDLSVQSVRGGVVVRSQDPDPRAARFLRDEEGGPSWGKNKNHLRF